MFKNLKNDSITKKIGKVRTEVKMEMEKNKISFLQAHFKMEEKIKSIYDDNKYRYRDLVKRKKHLTEFNDNLKNILISLIFGFISSVFFETIKSIASQDCTTSKDKNLFAILTNTVFITIIFISIELIIVYLILKCSHKLSSEDMLNTKDYELDIIKEKLKEYENNYKNKDN